MLSANIFIIREARRLEQTTLRPLSAEDQNVLSDLNNRATRFNSILTSIQSVRVPEKFKLPLIQKIFEHASSSQINLLDMRVDDDGSILLSGQASSEDKIVIWKKILKDNGFENINLPLSNIRKENSYYVFTMSFSWTFSKTL